MALTLIESAKIALGRDETLRATIMELYAQNSEIVQFMPFMNIQGNSFAFNREAELANAGFRGVNEGYTEGTSKVDKHTETLCIAGGDLDVDKFLVDTGGPGQRATQEQLKIKALSLSLAKTIIKGDSGDNPKEFDGLQVRAAGEQLIAAGSTSGGDALALSKLDELIDAVEGGNALIMNKAMRRRLTQAARNSSVGGYITYDVDAFGRRITKYNDLPILIADKDNLYNDILPFTEVCPGGGAAGTSIYCVSLMEDGVVGLQNGNMEVRDLGELESKPVFRTRIEWYISLAVLKARGFARLYGIKDAAVTA